MNLLNNEIELCDSFAGIGALHESLTRLGIKVKLTCMSEIDCDAIISYGASKDIDISNIETPSIDKMKFFLMERNIGWDFQKQKSSIPRMKKDKLELVYKYSVACNNFGDISLIKPSELPSFDMFNFSFPCTDISVAGKQEGMKDQKGNLTRSGLYIYGINIIKTKKPKYIMIENVKNLIGKKFINDFYDIVNELDEISYNCYYPKKDNGQPKCLNAKDYGIPQNRERIFVICIRKDVDDLKFEFPKGFDNGIRLKDMLENDVDDKYYISEDKTQSIISQLNDKKSLLLDMCQAKREGKPREYTDISPTLSARDYKEPRLINENSLNTENNKIICEQRCDEGLRFFKDNICGTIRTIDSGGDKRVLETTFDNLDTIIPPSPELVGGIGEINFGKQYRQGNRIYSAEKTAMCLMSQPVGNTGGYSYLYNVDYKIRKLTPKECWRLMGFKDYQFKKAKNTGISDSALYKQAGNSIVVDVLYYIFKNLFETKNT